MSGIERIVINIASDFAAADEKLSLDDQLMSVAVSSLKVKKLIAALEDEFYVRFSDFDLESAKAKTLADIAALISESIPA